MGRCRLVVTVPLRRTYSRVGWPNTSHKLTYRACRRVLHRDLPEVAGDLYLASHGVLRWRRKNHLRQI